MAVAATLLRSLIACERLFITVRFVTAKAKSRNVTFNIAIEENLKFDFVKVTFVSFSRVH